MKYRRLTIDELAELEPEFIRFLAANTITGPDWAKLKKENLEKAENLIDIFSDLIFDRSLRSAEYLEHREPKDLKTFHFLPEKVILNGLRVEGEVNFDFTENLTPEQMLGRIRLTGATLKLYTAQKRYRQEREQEMFVLLESGARISRDGTLFKALEELKG